MRMAVAVSCALAWTVGGCIDWSSLYGDASSTGAIGCSDGTREAAAGYADVAACAGAWTVPGVIDELAPGCALHAGNDGSNAAGTGCNVTDLCDAGWHVCRSRADVTDHGGGNACIDLASLTTEIYVTRQRGDRTTDTCATGASTMTDDVYGCGGLGVAVMTCGPLNRKLALATNCTSPYHCGTNETQEAANVFKSAASAGGVLCCRD